MGAVIQAIAPFFIVSDVARTVAFYVDKLGFEAMHRQPETEPFFAIVHRDGAMVFLKNGETVQPQPNPRRQPAVKWDAYVLTLDPDALAVEFTERGVVFRRPLGMTSEGLRGFEIGDPDGYVLFFGRPG